jgi:hypothetical protein
VRGRKNVAKRVLVQAAAFNLALILRSITKAGTPRGLADLTLQLFSALCRALDALAKLSAPIPAPGLRFLPISPATLRPPAKLGSCSSRISYRRKRVF